MKCHAIFRVKFCIGIGGNNNDDDDDDDNNNCSSSKRIEYEAVAAAAEPITYQNRSIK